MLSYKKTICNLENIELIRISGRKEFKLIAESLLLDSAITNKLPIIGRSGGGKSTLLETLATMLSPTNGKISWTFFDNNNSISFSWSRENPLSTSDIALLRTSYFGFAFQDTTLTSSLTVLENLIYPQKLVNPEIAIEKASLRLNQVFTDEKKDRHIAQQYPHQLSGGQRQRVALLQAMINDPYVLFADEPTGNLDIETRKEVMEVIEVWQKHTGGLFLWVTHHESDLNKKMDYISVCDGVVTMNHV